MRATMIIPLAALALVTGCGGGSSDPAASASPTPAGLLGQVQAAATAAQGATFADLVVVGARDTAQQRQAQATQCASVEAAKTQVEALPTTGAERLETQVAAYRSTVLPALSEVARYCTYYVKTIEVAAQQESVAQRFGALVVPKGETATYNGRTITCAQDSCLPGDADRADYLEALQESQELAADALALRAGTTTPCRLTDLEAVCAVTKQTAKVFAQADALVLSRFTALPSFAATPVITATYAQAKALADPAAARVTAAYAKAFPGLDTTASSYEAKNEVRLLQAYEKTVADAPVPTG